MKKNKKTISRKVCKNKFEKLKETFKNIKFRNVITNKKRKRQKTELQLQEIINMVENHKDILKKTILKAFDIYDYFKKKNDISKKNFTFWDTYFFYNNIGEKTFYDKREPWKNVYYQLLPKLLIGADKNTDKKTDAIKFVKCFAEVQLVSQKGSVIQKYRVVGDDLIVDEENWIDSNNESDESEENDECEESSESDESNMTSISEVNEIIKLHGNSVTDKIDIEKREVNVNELELQNNSPALHAYFIENRNHLENHLKILNDLRQLQISESSILAIIKSKFPKNVLNEIAEKLKKWSNELIVGNIRLFSSESKIHLLLVHDKSYDSLEEAIGTVFRKYNDSEMCQLTPKNMQIVVDRLEKEIIIYNDIDKEIERHQTTNPESQSPIPIRLYQSVDGLKFINKYENILI